MKPELYTVEAAECGLKAFIVVDSTALGPAAGGIRTRRYASEADALADVHALAKAMTLKCAISGLDAGGGKCVVMDHPGLNRPEAFARLGAFVEGLGGLFRTAGDVGTREQDLTVMARHCQYVHLDETGLTEAVADGVLACLQGVADASDSVLDYPRLRVTLQGCGAIGAALAHALHRRGSVLTLSDIDADRVSTLASELDAKVCGPDEVWSSAADVLAPCAVGGLLDERAAATVAADVVCGAANNILSSPRAEDVLRQRGVTYVPDFISSAGAVIRGISRTVMTNAQGDRLIAALRGTTTEVLAIARRDGLSATESAVMLAKRRLDAAG